MINYVLNNRSKELNFLAFLFITNIVKLERNEEY